MKNGWWMGVPPGNLHLFLGETMGWGMDEEVITCVMAVSGRSDGVATRIINDYWWYVDIIYEYIYIYIYILLHIYIYNYI